jgi:iron complex outermembrane receptor protein
VAKRATRWILAVLCLSPGAPAIGQQQKPHDLASQSLEELMNVEVTSVSKKKQKLSRTAAAVFVVSQEDIQRSGATNIPDLLRMVPGMEVAPMNGNTWAVSARGLNGQFSNELLVLVDGRNAYTPTFGGVFWDTLAMSLDNIERIEVIRGPGGSIWGENAVNGVVNIIQKKAEETRGGKVTASEGNDGQVSGTVQYGGTLGKNTDYRVYSKYFHQGDMSGVGGGEGGGGWHMLRGGFRTDTTLSEKDVLTFQGKTYTGREGDPATTLPSITSTARVYTDLFVNLSGGFLQSIWAHTYSERSDSTLMVSYGGYERSDLLGNKRKTLNIDFHHHLAWGSRHELVWGLGYRLTAENSDGTIEVSLIPPGQTTNVISGFVQDEIALILDRFYFTVGTKLEHNTYSGFAPLPSARAVYEFNGRRMVWAGVSHAVRIPAETDVDLRLNVVGVSGPDGTPAVISVLGNPHSKDEGVIAYEAGYRAEVGQRVSVDLAAYYNTYNNQDSTEPAAPFFEATPLPAHLVLPSISQNLIDGETHGAEIVTKWKVSKRCTLIPSYDLERIHMHSRPPSEDTTTAPDTNGSDPHQHARVGSQVGLPHRVTWDTAARFTDRLPAQGRALVHQAGYQCAVAVDRASNARRRWPKFVASAAPGIYR